LAKFSILLSYAEATIMWESFIAEHKGDAGPLTLNHRLILMESVTLKRCHAHQDSHFTRVSIHLV